MYDAYVSLTLRPYLEYNFDLYETVIKSYIEREKDWVDKKEVNIE